MSWGQTDLTKKLAGYAEQNVANAFGLTQKLIQAKDLQELVALQTEFFQTQLKVLGDQAKDIGETATKTTTDAIMNKVKPRL